MITNILIEKPEYPIESIFKNFNVLHVQEVYWRHSDTGVEEYLYIELEPETLPKLLAFFDVTQFASIANYRSEDHMYVYKKYPEKASYRGCMMSSSKAQVALNKDLIYLHFKDYDMYLTFNHRSTLKPLSEILQ